MAQNERRKETINSVDAAFKLNLVPIHTLHQLPNFDACGRDDVTTPPAVPCGTLYSTSPAEAKVDLQTRSHYINLPSDQYFFQHSPNQEDFLAISRRES